MGKKSKQVKQEEITPEEEEQLKELAEILLEAILLKHNKPEE